MPVPSGRRGCAGCGVCPSLSPRAASPRGCHQLHSPLLFFFFIFLRGELLHFTILISFLGKKVQVRKPAPGASDAVPSRKRPTPVNLASAIKRGNSAISQRPFKDRVVHLLALKPYKKPELILRLQKDGLSQQDKDLLDNLLQQVCTLDEGNDLGKGKKKKKKSLLSPTPPSRGSGSCYLQAAAECDSKGCGGHSSQLPVLVQR